MWKKNKQIIDYLKYLKKHQISSEFYEKYKTLSKRLYKNKDLYQKYTCKNPILTINMPTYNGEKYIARALESILMQETVYTYKIRIFDDKSTDNTINIVKEYQDLYPNIIDIEVNEQNEKGKTVGYKIYNSVNTKYWMNFDQDDYWLSTSKLERLLDFLELHNDFSVASSACYIKTSNELHPTYCNCCDWNIKFKFDDYPTKKPIFMQTSATIFRNLFTQEDLNKINSYKGKKEEPAIWGDTFRNIFALSKGKGYFENSIDSVYNWVETGVWSKLNSVQQDFYNLEQMYYLIDFFEEKDYKNQMKDAANVFLRKCIGRKDKLTEEEQGKLREFQESLKNAK